MTLPTLGSAAPAFSLPANGGKTVSLSDFRGKKLVLYFYPKDSTPGCTKQAVGFTALKDQFEAADTVILGVSKDSLKRHENFIEKQNLAISLLSDENSDICERYGVWQEKKLYGRTFMGIVRTTFLIDREGRIAQVWPKVKVAGHVEEVLRAAQDLI